MSESFGTFYWFINEGILFFCFLATCFLLGSRKYNKKITLLVAALFALVVFGINFILLATGSNVMQILSFLPLTIYLPAIICLHILSKNSFFQTVTIWSIGLIGYFALCFFTKAVKFLNFNGLAGILLHGYNILFVFAVFLICSLLVFIVAKFMRLQFKRCAWNVKINWVLLSLAMLLTAVVFSYFSWSALNAFVAALMCILSFIIFPLLVKAFKFLYSSAFIKQRASCVDMQMKIQQGDYEAVCKKIQDGREYRHDMRHHFAALSAILQQGDNSDALKYIHDLNDKMGDIESIIYCENTIVNAVLSFYASQACAAGCKININSQLPKCLPFEDTDLCVILSNILENAIYACEKICNKDKKTISVNISYQHEKMAVSVENSCFELLLFDEFGIPTKPKREGHGIGLKSVQTVVKKYNGCFDCFLRNNVFTVKAVIFKPYTMPPSKKSKKNVSKILASFMCFCLLSFCLLTNVGPVAAASLENVPVLGRIVRVITLKSYSLRWGDTRLRIWLPKIDDGGYINGGNSSHDGNSSNDINRQTEEYIKQLKSEFLYYLSIKYNGYVGMDVNYSVITDNSEALCLRVYTTVNLGGSGDVSRIYTLDKLTGKSLTLENLFVDNSDYVKIISAEITSQMERQMSAGEGDYFLPGGIWRDDECFKNIDSAQNFYINGQGQLVIVFDEYTVAPGSMGCPEFAIKSELLSAILIKNSLVK